MRKTDESNPIFTFWQMKSGSVFEFYPDKDRTYTEGEEVEVWCNRTNGFLGDKIVYGRCRITETPARKNGLHKAMIISVI